MRPSAMWNASQDTIQMIKRDAARIRKKKFWRLSAVRQRSSCWRSASGGLICL